IADDVRGLVVRVWTILAETGERNQNQLAIFLKQCLIAKIVVSKISGLKGFEKNIRARHKFEQQLSPGFFGDIQSDAALASVQISEPQTSFLMDMAFRKRRFAPSRVAAGRFNFDYIHPQVAKQLAAKRA